MTAPVPKAIPHGAAGPRRMGTIHAQAPAIYLHEKILDQVIAHSESDTSREVGGFLIGGLHRQGHEFLEIRHYLPAAAQGDAASLSFTHETWSALNREVEKRFPKELVLGWHHTHPGMGVFFSGYDTFLHENFFNQPWQIALVVDPLRCELVFFQWLEGHLVDCGFYLVPAR